MSRLRVWIRMHLNSCVRLFFAHIVSICNNTLIRSTATNIHKWYGERRVRCLIQQHRMTLKMSDVRDTRISHIFFWFFVVLLLLLLLLLSPTGYYWRVPTVREGFVLWIVNDRYTPHTKETKNEWDLKKQNSNVQCQGIINESWYWSDSDERQASVCCWSAREGGSLIGWYELH